MSFLRVDRVIREVWDSVSFARSAGRGHGLCPGAVTVWEGVGKYEGSHLPCVRPGAAGTAPPATSWSRPGGQSQTWEEVWEDRG